MVADLPVKLVVNQLQLAAEVAELFQPMADHDGPCDASITIETDAPARPDREPDEVYGLVSLWRDGNELIVDSGGSVRGHATRYAAVIGGATEGGYAGAVMLRRVIHHVIAHLLSVNGRLVAHGAAVGRGGTAVLLLGPSGSGKSTSAYLASLAGWSLLSDDLVVVRRSGELLDAIGVHRAVAVPREVADATAANIDFDPRARRRPHVQLDPRAHRIGAVALVEHGVGTGAAVAVGGVEVARAFLGSTPAAGNTDVAAEALRAAGALASLRCFRLLLPDTAAERLNRVGELLAEIAAPQSIDGHD